MRFVVIVLAVLSFNATAYGQEVSDGVWAGAPVKVPAARPDALAKIFVQPTRGGAELAGYLLQLGPDRVTLLINGQRVELPLDQVQRIQAPRRSIARGARLGGLIGGVWCALICGQGVTDGRRWAAAVAVNTGVFAAIGAGIQATTPRRATLFEQAPPQVARVRPSVSWTVAF